jgi:mRNA-degrading endonuclease YafQ of YafQ-DinJ toxin-antitoxin module
MTVKWRKSFAKDYNKLDQSRKKAWYKAWLIFKDDPNHIKLRRHRLKGKYIGLESIDISPDLRALFVEIGSIYVFYYLRNHSRLYN